MITKELLELYDCIDRPGKMAPLVAKLFKKAGATLLITDVKGPDGSTQSVKVVIKGKGHGKTLGVIGRLGGVGARPERMGLVSDGDGALSSLAVALRLARMNQNGDVLDGDVIITTHLCTDAPTEPHDPVPFMGSPIDINTMNQYEVDTAMEAIFSIDTSRGNRIINTNSFAISPTVKEGWILRVSEDLLTIMQQTTGSVPFVLPISMQDITPYGNDIYHFNSIMQPAIATTAPVVGVAITSELPVPGCGTGVSNISQLDQVGRFVIESAIAYTAGTLQVFDELEFKTIINRYGSMAKLQTVGKERV